MNELSTNDRLWTLVEVADSMGLTYQRLYQDVYNRRLPRPARKAGRTWLLTNAEVEVYHQYYENRNAITTN